MWPGHPESILDFFCGASGGSEGRRRPGVSILEKEVTVAAGGGGGGAGTDGSRKFKTNPDLAMAFLNLRHRLLTTPEHTGTRKRSALTPTVPKAGPGRCGYPHD